MQNYTVFENNDILEVNMLVKDDCELFSSGLKGSEAAFGEIADKYGVKETVFTFEDHNIARAQAGNVIVLSDDDLGRGDISMEIVSTMMNRTYYESKKIRKVLQALFHVVNRGHQVFVVGTILDDGTVKGGTGWAAELAKLFNRPLSVFDQEEEKWFSWLEGAWQEKAPKIEFDSFVGSGTRNLSEAGRQAIEDLFEQAFG
jgi:hypothetical protein